tara:strand:+ start:3267 stop:3839 length:573 start_codon:yes stop_codon:yes gene_type:complete
MIVSVNDFVRRQVKGSGKTYAKTLSFKEIVRHAEEQMFKKFYSNGYRDGVRLVEVANKFIDDFVCPYVKIDKDTKLISKLVKRQPNEEPYIQTRALNGKKVRTGKVELILYRNDILLENNENTTNADWELISINALPQGLGKLPIGPITMMRNQLNLVGGTKANYSSDEWAQSVWFWQKYATLQPESQNV